MTPRVLLSWDATRILGPLGCYELGQKVDLEDGQVVIVNIDHDGAGVGIQTGFLKRYAEEKQMSGEQVMQKFSKHRTPNVDIGKAGYRQQDQITKTILANRKANGLSEEDPRGLKEGLGY